MPVLHRGLTPTEARAALILVHGRGASAEDILLLAKELDAPDFALLAPQAAGGSWYPRPFLAPLEENEPALSSALEVLRGLTASLAAAGVPYERIGLLGFSQGACLVLEFAARRPRRYGAVFGLSGGLIGPPGTVWPAAGGPIGPPGTLWPAAGSLAGTPVFLGCGDADPHIPAQRVRESAEALAALGAEVTLQLYPGLGHRVVPDELDRINERLRHLRQGLCTGRASPARFH
jgi:predicted esterase